MILSLFLSIFLHNTVSAQPYTLISTYNPDSELLQLAQNFATKEELEFQEKLLNNFVNNAFRLGIGAALDIYFTAYCVNKNPSCAEKNPLGFSAEARQALKAGTTIVALKILYELDKRGHFTLTKWLARGLLFIQGALAANNLYQAHR